MDAKHAAPFGSLLMVLAAVLAMSLVQFQQMLEVALPAAAPAALDAYTRQVIVEITADRVITLNNVTVSLSELEGRLQQVLASRNDKTLYVIGAGSLRYGDVVPLIDAAYGAGAQRVGIVTERLLELSRQQATAGAAATHSAMR